MRSRRRLRLAAPLLAACALIGPAAAQPALAARRIAPAATAAGDGSAPAARAVRVVREVRRVPESRFTCITIRVPRDHFRAADRATVDVTFGVLRASSGHRARRLRHRHRRSRDERPRRRPTATPTRSIHAITRGLRHRLLRPARDRPVGAPPVPGGGARVLHRAGRAHGQRRPGARLRRRVPGLRARLRRRDGRRSGRPPLLLDGAGGGGSRRDPRRARGRTPRPVWRELRDAARPDLCGGSPRSRAQPLPGRPRGPDADRLPVLQRGCQGVR